MRQAAHTPTFVVLAHRRSRFPSGALLTIVIGLIAGVAPAYGDAMEQAQASCRQRLSNAPAALSVTIDEQIKEAANHNRTDEIAPMLAAKNALMAEGTLPATPELAEQRLAFDAEAAAAANVLLLATNDAVVALSRAGRVDEAAALAAQVRQLIETQTAGGPIGQASQAGDPQVQAAIKAHDEAIEAARADLEKQLAQLAESMPASHSSHKLLPLVKQGQWDDALATDPDVRIARARYILAESKAQTTLKAALMRRYEQLQRAGDDAQAAAIVKVAKERDISLEEHDGTTTTAAATNTAPREIGAPAESKIIAEDVHEGRAANHPSYTRNTTYTMKIGAGDPLVRAIGTSVACQAYQPEDKANTKGTMSVSLDYGKTWHACWKWEGADFKQAKRRNNWITVPIASGLRKYGSRMPANQEIDELQVKFAVDGLVEEIRIDRVAWVRN